MAKFSLFLLAAPLALTAIAAPAVAQDEARTVHVRYDDLNLASEKGRERLTTRVKMAVRQVCDTRLAQGLRAKMIAGRCEDAAMRDADVKLASLFNGDGTALAGRGQVVVTAP